MTVTKQFIKIEDSVPLKQRMANFRLKKMNSLEDQNPSPKKVNFTDNSPQTLENIDQQQFEKDIGVPGGSRMKLRKDPFNKLKSLM